MARAPSEELKIPGAAIKTLQSIEDVTSRVEAAAPADATEAVAETLRQKMLSGIEKECTNKDADRSCQVVALAEGARYELHRYRDYSDVRLVFCPPQSVAFFHSLTIQPSADFLDSFNLDLCVFRAYEKNMPAHFEHYLKWADTPLRAGDLVFASGFPAFAVRQQSLLRLEYRRDVELPGLMTTQQQLISAFGDLLSRSSGTSPYVDGRALSDLRMYESELALLQDPVWIRHRREREEQFKAQLSKSTNKQTMAAYERLGALLDTQRVQSKCYALIKEDALVNQIMVSFDYARELVALGDALGKPEAQRPERYREPMLGFVRAWLAGSDFETVHPDIEQVELGVWLQRLSESLCPEDPLVKDLLAGQSARAVASRIMTGTQIGNLAFHKTLLSGDDRTIAAAIAQTNDPFLVLARRLQAEEPRLAAAEQNRKKIEATEREITHARYLAMGGVEYPDATGTLRLSYGTVQGYELGGRKLPPASSFGDFNRWVEQHPQDGEKLPANWTAARRQLNPGTPFNFASTLDIVSGSSGSPIVNRAGEWVGVAQSSAPTKASPTAYDPERSRAIGIAGTALIEALRKVYGAAALADELVNGHR